MSLVGIIGTDTCWVGVSDPDPGRPQPKAPWWRLFLGLEPKQGPPLHTAIRRTDFRDPEITEATDRMVAASLTIGSAQAVKDGVLGQPDAVGSLVVRNLIAKLTDALEADRLIAQYADKRDDAISVSGASEIIAELDGSTARVKSAMVDVPAEELEELADQMKLLDLWMLSPKVKEQLGRPVVDSFDDIAALVLTAKDIASVSRG